MSIIQKTKPEIKSKVAASVALVALSGFVPQPLINNAAEAATATISVSGSFITGIQLAAGTSMNFGSVAVATAAAKMTLGTNGINVPTGGKAVAVGGAQAGTFKFTAVSTVPNLDITAKCIEANGLILADTAGGKVAANTAKLVKIIVGGVGTAVTTVDMTGGTTGSLTGYDLTSKTGPLKIGGVVTWTAVPFGAFQAPLILTVGY